MVEVLEEKAKEREVDLFTIDNAFVNIIVREYSGLREEQYHIDDSDPQEKVYGFLNLDYDKLFRFLPKYINMREFEVRDTKTGEFICVSRRAYNRVGS